LNCIPGSAGEGDKHEREADNTQAEEAGAAVNAAAAADDEKEFSDRD